MVNVERLDFSRVDHCDFLHEMLFTNVDSILSLGWKSSNQIIDPASAYEYLVELDTIYKVGPYLVAYAIHTPWYSKEPVLVDLLVLRYDNSPGRLQDVTDFLEAEARQSNVSWVAVGTLLASNDRALVRGYERCGYEVAATQLIKEMA